MVTRRPTSSSVIPTSSACRHVAMLPFLVQIFPNEESTNLIPVPWMLASSRPVSRNRSSRYWSSSAGKTPRAILPDNCPEVLCPKNDPDQPPHHSGRIRGASPDFRPCRGPCSPAKHVG